jgi:PBP1b-binding outer membrane lipoprotein LpoB
MKHLSATISSLLLLSACAQPCQQIAVKQWSDAEQDQMRDAIDQLPPDSILIPAMLDYKRLRTEAAR